MPSPEAVSTSRQTHVFRVRVDAYRGATRIAADLPVLSGSVTLDASSPTYRSARLEIVGEEWTRTWYPTTPSSPLAPFGQHLVIRRGIVLPDERVEWTSFGQFPIQEVVTRRPTGIVEVEAGDWSNRVDEYGFTFEDKPRNPRATPPRPTMPTPLAEIQRLITDAVVTPPAWVHDGTLDGKTIDKDQTYTVGASRWAAVREIANSDGADVWFQDDGSVGIKRALDRLAPKTTPDAWLVVGGDKGSVTEIREIVSREGAVNGVIVRREGRSTKSTKDPKPLTGKAYSTGGIAWGDTFGRLPYVVSESWGTKTQAAVDERARTLLEQRQGVSRTVELDALPQPWIRPRNTVEVRYLDGRVERHLVQSVTHPLTGAGDMKVRTRLFPTLDPGRWGG